MSVVAYYCAAGHGLQYTAEVEAPGFLARRKFTETLKPLTKIGCRRGKNEGVVDKPAAVIDALVLAPFKGVTSQVGDEGARNSTNGCRQTSRLWASCLRKVIFHWL